MWKLDAVWMQWLPKVLVNCTKTGSYMPVSEHGRWAPCWVQRLMQIFWRCVVELWRSALRSSVAIEWLRFYPCCFRWPFEAGAFCTAATNVSEDLFFCCAVSVLGMLQRLNVDAMDGPNPLVKIAICWDIALVLGERKSWKDINMKQNIEIFKQNASDNEFSNSSRGFKIMSHTKLFGLAPFCLTGELWFWFAGGRAWRIICSSLAACVLGLPYGAANAILAAKARCWPCRGSVNINPGAGYGRRNSGFAGKSFQHGGRGQHLQACGRL